jgi:hypothetical protein
MNAEDKTAAKERITEMKDGGGPNTWDARKVGCEQAK